MTTDPSSPHHPSHPEQVPPRFCRSPEDFEEAAAEWMRRWGFRDARRTMKGPDSGIDVDSTSAVAQVKAWMIPIGRPEIQKLRGVVYDGRKAVFFSLMAYTDEAMDFAVASGVALFRFTGYDGGVEALNNHAEELVSQAKRNSVATPLGASDALKQRVLTAFEEIIGAPECYSAYVILIAEQENRFVQFACDSDVIRGESISNKYLEEGKKLSMAEEQMLSRIGWNQPHPDHGDNYWLKWPRSVQPMELAEFAIKTLFHVHRASDERITIEKHIEPIAPPISSPVNQSAGDPNGPSKKGCFIATAVYGSTNHPNVVKLRRFRDNHLEANVIGRTICVVYYWLSPRLAKGLFAKPRVRGVMRNVLNWICRRL